MTPADEVPSPPAFEANKGEIVGGLAKKAAPGASLKESLKKKLRAQEEEEENREPSSEMPELGRRKPDVYRNLRPAGLDGILNADGGGESDSLTLFDIVRMKLRECTAKQHL